MERDSHFAQKAFDGGACASKDKYGFFPRANAAGLYRIEYNSGGFDIGIIIQEEF
jgi:hypothetical protein